MKTLTYFLLFTALTFQLHGEYSYNPEVKLSTWQALEPYFLPEDHPAKEKLDLIFSSRVTLNQETLEKAGFKIIKLGRANRPKIVSHPDIAGYLLKLYFDSQRGVDETVNFKKRLKGAKIAREIIEANHYESYFVVPNKWIYPIPLEPLPPDNKKYDPKHFVLVVDAMDVYKKESNIDCWNNWFTTDFVLALFTLLDVGGFSDSTFVFNLPFTKDGKIAIIDTEIYHSWPINYKRLNQYFSSEMVDYWISLTH